MYSSILVAIDPDQPRSWSDALPAASALARCFSARLTLCTVVRDAEAAVEAQWSAIGYRDMIEQARTRLATIADEVPDLPVSVAVGPGTICNGILDLARSHGADLIVLASHRPELKDHVISANAARVARRAACSVLIVRDGKDGGGSVPGSSVPAAGA